MYPSPRFLGSSLLDSLLLFIYIKVADKKVMFSLYLQIPQRYSVYEEEENLAKGASWN